MILSSVLVSLELSWAIRSLLARREFSIVWRLFLSWVNMSSVLRTVIFSSLWQKNVNMYGTVQKLELLSHLTIVCRLSPLLGSDSHDCHDKGALICQGAFYRIEISQFSRKLQFMWWMNCNFLENWPISIVWLIPTCNRTHSSRRALFDFSATLTRVSSCRTRSSVSSPKLGLEWEPPLYGINWLSSSGSGEPPIPGRALYLFGNGGALQRI